MGFFQGESKVLYFKDGDDWWPAGCLTSNDFSEGVEILGTTTRTPGGWRTFVPTIQFYRIDFQGFQIVSGSTGNSEKFSYDRIKELKRARTRIEWKIESTGGEWRDSGFGYIIDLGEAAPAGDFLTFNGLLEGYGEPIFERDVLESQGDLWQDGNTMIFQDGNHIIL